MDTIKITEDKKEMATIGKSIVEERRDIYTSLMIDKIIERIKQEFPKASDEQVEQLLFCSIYDYWVYGNNIDEEFYLKLYEKNHEQKSSYMTNRIRGIYVDYLNCDGNPRMEYKSRKAIADQLESKYDCYELLKPYYKRDVIQILDGNDFEIFKEFVLKHPVFVAKPSDFYYGIGVHKVDLSDYDSIEDCFKDLLSEGAKTQGRHPSRNSSLVLEELIIQSKELAAFHPSSINGIRVTTVRNKDGKIVVHHPWIKVGVGGSFVASAALDGFDAEIDPKTGIIISDGASENGHVYKVHPDSGITIKGYQIPKWDELLEFVDEIMKKVPTYGYIGWDLVLTDNGWVVMEANYSGEFTWQLIRGEGGKKEFEDLIGWKMDADFWWQIKPFIITKK